MLQFKHDEGVYHFKHPPQSPHQVGEIVPVLSAHQAARVAEACDVLDVGLQAGWVGLQHNVNERWEEIVGRCRLFLRHLDGIEDVFATAGDAGQLVSRHTL